MELYWNGTDITGKVNITGCIYRDAAGCSKDTLDITLDNAAQWYQWAPEEDDRITVNYNGFSTGEMYLDAVIPDRDQYRVIATSVKRAGIRRAWNVFRDATLAEIMDNCASECQMTWQLYGTDGDLRYRHIIRRNEKATSFMKRIMFMEGAALKAYNGKFRGIDIQFAQKREPAQTLWIDDQQDGIKYQRRALLKYSRVIVQTPYAHAEATDKSVSAQHEIIITNEPALDDAQAGRWARGMLTNLNREAEELRVEQGMNTNMTALARVDIDGGTDADGRWLVQEAEHDFYNKRTVTTMHRVIDTVE